MNIIDKFNIYNEFIDIKNDLEYKCNILKIETDDEIWEFYIRSNHIYNNVANYIRRVKNEYDFFNTLHRQTKYDNIISIIKICQRLDIDYNNIIINISNPNFDDIWSQINEQICIEDLINFIDDYKKFINLKLIEESKEQIKENYGEVLIGGETLKNYINVIPKFEYYNYNDDHPRRQWRERLDNNSPHHGFINVNWTGE